MLNSATPILLLIVLILPLLTGCGISQEKYDMAVTELETVRQQLTDLNEQKETVDGEVAVLTDNLSVTRGNLYNLLAELASVFATNENLSVDLSTLEEAYSSNISLAKTLRDRNKPLKDRIPDIEYEHFEHKDVKFTFDYPSEMVYTVDTDEFGSVIVSFKRTWNTPNIMIQYGDNQGAATSQKILDDMKTVKISGLEVTYLPNTTISVDGHVGTSCLAFFDDGGVETSINQFIVLTNRSWYLIIGYGCFWSDYLYFTYIFNEIVDSIELLF